MTAQNGIAHSKTNRLAARVLPVMAAFLLLTLIFISPAQAQLGGAQPPPVGDGDTPMPVTPGDTSGAVGVPSGTADNTSGSNFSTGTGHDRTIVRLYKQDTNGRGQRMVQPSVLTLYQTMHLTKSTASWASICSQASKP